MIGAHGKRGSKLTKIEDFLINWDGSDEPKVQSADDMKNFLLGFASQQNKKVNESAKKKKNE